MRKVIQIVPVLNDDKMAFFALCEDGTMWSAEKKEADSPVKWIKIPEIPDA